MNCWEYAISRSWRKTTKSFKKNVSDNILKSLQNFTATKERYVDSAYSQWKEELHSLVQLEGVKFA